MPDEKPKVGWSDYFSQVSSLLQVFRIGDGPAETLVQQLSDSPVPHHSWRTSPLGPAVRAWAFLDGGVHFIQGTIGSGLAAGVRVIGFRAMRYVGVGLQLAAPPDPLPGEDAVPTFEELSDAFHAGLKSPELNTQALLLSAVSDATALRDFVTLVNGGALPTDLATSGEDLVDRLELQRILFGAGQGPVLASQNSETVPAARPAMSPATDAVDATLAQVFLQQYSEADAEGDYSGIDFYEGDDDWFDPDEVTADQVVKLKWMADYGMPSGSASWSLLQFPDGSAVTLRDGDDQSEPELEDLPLALQSRAEVMVNWCDIYGPLAALALEPLDPEDTLTEEVRDEWRSTIARAPSSIAFGLDDPTKTAVRSAFVAADNVYARVKAALAAPNSDEGRLLLQVIDFLSVGPNEFCAGDWDSLNV